MTTPLLSVSLRHLHFVNCTAVPASSDRPTARLTGGVLDIASLAAGPSEPLSVIVESCTFTGCAACCAGGAIAIAAEHRPVAVTLRRSTFIGNTVGGCTAPQMGGRDCPALAGGAVWVSSDEDAPNPSALTVDQCVFESNAAGNGKDKEKTRLDGDADGGALWVGATNVTMTGSTWANNSAAGSGGGLLIQFAQADINDCFFRGNSATSQSELVGGGAVYSSFMTSLSVSGSRFEDNTVHSSGSRKDSAFGGALFSSLTAALAVKRCSFARNIANEGAGGAVALLYGHLEVTDSDFVENSAITSTDAPGGAMFVFSTEGEPSAIIRNSTFVSNKVTCPNDEGHPQGGALALAALGNCASLDGLIFRDNSVESLRAVAPALGGALSFTACGTIKNSRFEGNQIRSKAGMGGAAAILEANVTVERCVFTENAISTSGQGQALYAASTISVRDCAFTAVASDTDWGSAQGGCLFIQGDADAPTKAVLSADAGNGPAVTEIMRTTFDGCHSVRGGAVALLSSGALIDSCSFTRCEAREVGGAVASDALLPELLTIVNSSFVSCEASTGGALFARSNVTVADSLFENCSASAQGGVARFEKAIVSVVRSKFDEDRCNGNGGVFHADSTVISIKQCNFTKNSAVYEGGVLSLFQGSLLLEECQCMGSQAHDGAILAAMRAQVDMRAVRFVQSLVRSTAAVLVEEGTFNIEEAVFSKNRAIFGTGACADLDVHESTGNLVNCTFEKAVASGRGGSCCVISGTAWLDKCLFSECSEDSLGALFSQRANLTVVDSLFYGNFARDSAGAVYVDGGTVTILGTSFIDNTAVVDAGALVLYRTAANITRSSFSGNLGGFVHAIGAHNSIVSIASTSFTRNGGSTLAETDAVLLGEESTGSLQDVKITDNSAVGVSLSGSHFAFEAGCVMYSNYGNRATPVNILLSDGIAELHESSGLRDKETGALWIIGVASEEQPRNDATHVYLAPLEARFSPPQPGDGKHAGIAIGSSQVVLRALNPAAYCPWHAACRFIETTSDFAPAYSDLARDGDEYTCRLPDAKKQSAFFVSITNDGHVFTDVGVLSINEDHTAAILGALSGAGFSVVVLLGLLAAYLGRRWVKLRKATAIELASWRETQIASVDFSRLKIRERIGQGASGEVFRGILDGTPVAVKRLFETAESDAELQAFRREVSMLKTLRHPFIVSFIGATLDNPRIIVTEYMARGSLFALLHNAAVQLPAPLRLQMALDMALGLNYLHHLSPPIVHRDVKSANMLVSAEMRVKVSDFGISRLSQDAGLTTAAGTPGWSSPEVLRGERSGVPSDVYSYGVCLWELFTRKVPWEGMPPLRVIQGVATGSRLPVPGDAPLVIRELMARCFAEDPAARPTMQQVADTLQPAIDAAPPPSSLLPASPSSAAGTAVAPPTLSAASASSSSSAHSASSSASAPASHKSSASAPARRKPRRKAKEIEEGTVMSETKTACAPLLKEGNE